jgi:hypothetical protein
MAKYEYKIRRVEGFRIVDIQHMHEDHVPGRPCKVKVDSGKWIECDSAMTARYYPQVDDYVVIQPDGYIYLNPKKVFEDKFEKVEE